jgi:hypothetical protein
MKEVALWGKEALGHHWVTAVKMNISTAMKWNIPYSFGSATSTTPGTHAKALLANPDMAPPLP